MCCRSSPTGRRSAFHFEESHIAWRATSGRSGSRPAGGGGGASAAITTASRPWKASGSGSSGGWKTGPGGCRGCLRNPWGRRERLPYLRQALAPAPPMYAELHCKTNFSFLEGASHADELVVRAAELKYAALAVTDRETLAGIVRAHGPAKEIGLKLLIGAQMHPIDAPPVVLWATDRASYGRLSRLITIGRRRAAKGECQTTL